jgi:DNA invertase Pin-like site-specific DNA recombinase
MRRAVIYSRVSTDKQTTENQERELREVAERAGWQIVKVYSDKGISGTKSKEQRPAFHDLYKDATRRKFDIVMVWAIDRLGRTLSELVGFLAHLNERKIELFIHKQALDTTTPAGKLAFQIISSFAEFERDVIAERVKAGLARTKANGTKLGRPTIAADKEAAILADLAAGGRGIRKLAKLHGVGVSVVQRLAGKPIRRRRAGDGEAEAEPP